MPLGNVETIYEALWGLLTPGVTVESVKGESVLMTLRYIVADAQPGPGKPPTADEVASVCCEHIEAAARSIGPSPEQVPQTEYDLVGAALILLALEPGFRGLLLKDRRKRAAERMAGIDVRTFTKRVPGKGSHETRLVRAVAEAMGSREYHFAQASAREAIAARQPAGTALADHWLLRYEQYYRLFTAANAIQANGLVVLGALREGDHDLAREFTGYSLYDYARYQLQLTRFSEEFGGLWIFADADVERAVADSVYLITQFAPWSHRADSTLRVLAAEHGELDPFLAAVEKREPKLGLIQTWIDRLNSCACDLANPDPGCRVHCLFTACQLYCDLLDSDWYALADWYREPPGYTAVVSSATLYQKLRLLGVTGDR
jgi:hypothetical protein